MLVWEFGRMRHSAQRIKNGLDYFRRPSVRLFGVWFRFGFLGLALATRENDKES